MGSTDLGLVHRHSAMHRKEVLASAMCGCFFCLKFFESSSIREWTDGEETALCPRCGIDAVLPQSDTYVLNSRLLSDMRRTWF